MRNQIAAAQRAGIRAVTVNSSNVDDWQLVYDDVERGAVDVLLVSPERLNNPGFRDAVLPRLAATAGLLVVDEAHCISDWGHDFRPDYRRIRTLLTELPPGTPVLATTATANGRVVADVAEQLATGGGETLVLRGALDRVVAAPRRAVAARRRAPLGVARRPPARPAGQRHRLLPDGRGHRRARVVPAQPRGRGGGLLGPHRRRRAPRRRGRPARQPHQGAGRHQRARHGLRQARPRLRRPPRRAAVADRLLPAGRPRRPRRRARRGRAAARRRGRGDLALLRLAGLPERGAGAAGAGRAVGRHGGRCRPPRSRRTSTCAAPGSRRCSRCSTSTVRCSA